MEKLINIIENYVEAENITENSNFKRDLGLASFDTVCMIAEIKNTLDINLKPEDFLRCKTVGKLWEYIETLL